MKVTLFPTLVWSAIAVPILCVAAYSYHIHSLATQQPLPPGDPNIGLGILYIAALLNIPTVILWGLLIISMVVRRKPGPKMT